MVWFAYAASMWAVLSAAGSLYLAAGGTVGTALLADEIRQRILVRDPAFVTALWVTAVLKLAAAVFAVALSRSWRPVVRRVMTVLAWITGVALSVWGSGYVVMGIFMLCGAVETPPSWGSGAARWYALV